MRGKNIDLSLDEAVNRASIVKPIKGNATDNKAFKRRNIKKDEQLSKEELDRFFTRTNGMV